MLKNTLLRQARMLCPRATPVHSFTTTQCASARSFQNAAFRRADKNDKEAEDGRHDAYSTSSQLGESEHEGQHSRTDRNIVIEYPGEHSLPASRPVQGRGGVHDKRTLPTFSLEGRVALITGGARGLGLVMAQALVVSGASVAIVDLNSM